MNIDNLTVIDKSGYLGIVIWGGKSVFKRPLPFEFKHQNRIPFNVSQPLWVCTTRKAIPLHDTEARQGCDGLFRKHFSVEEFPPNLRD